MPFILWRDPQPPGEVFWHRRLGHRIHVNFQSRDTGFRHVLTARRMQTNSRPEQWLTNERLNGSLWTSRVEFFRLSGVQAHFDQRPLPDLLTAINEVQGLEFVTDGLEPGSGEQFRELLSTTGSIKDTAELACYLRRIDFHRSILESQKLKPNIAR